MAQTKSRLVETKSRLAETESRLTLTEFRMRETKSRLVETESRMAEQVGDLVNRNTFLARHREALEQEVAEGRQQITQLLLTSAVMMY